MSAKPPPPVVTMIDAWGRPVSVHIDDAQNRAEGAAIEPRTARQDIAHQLFGVAIVASMMLLLMTLFMERVA